MRPELLLLLLLLPRAESAASPDGGSTGTDFLIAFPEKITFYHPTEPTMKIQVSVLSDNTQVTIKQPGQATVQETLAKGTVKDWDVHKSLELHKAEISKKSVHVTSTNAVTVQAIGSKGSSRQTALVIPTNKLASEYLIPPVPAIHGTTTPANLVTKEVTERRPFNLVIVNGAQPNTVTISGTQTKELSLGAYETGQVLLEGSAGYRRVKASQPVAVLFGHSCAMRTNCSCGQLYALLPPPKPDKLKFYIPPYLAEDVEDQSLVLLSDQTSTKVESYNLDSPLVETSGAAIFYRPGLLLSLIPDTDFAACFVVSSIPDTKSYAVILVHKDQTEGIYVGGSPLDAADWEQLAGSDYEATKFELPAGESVIWHESSTMAVYFFGHAENMVFGNPGHDLGKVPDFRGCVLTPEVVTIGKQAGGWRESLKSCRDQDMELVSFPQAQLQNQIYKKIKLANTELLPEVWFAMRRRAVDGEWYWQGEEPAVSDTNWAPGEPGPVTEGQCAMLSLAAGQEFSWSDEDCCKVARPVCYKEPEFYVRKDDS